MHPIVTLLAIAAIVMGIQLGMRYLRSKRLVYWLKRGMTAYKAERFDEALRAFRKCVRIAPEWLYARTLMSISLARAGDTAKALDEIKMVEALQPREAETWALISTFYAVCMPDKPAPLVEALKRLTSIDERAALILLDQPTFARSCAAPQIRTLQQQIATNAAMAKSESGN